MTRKLWNAIAKIIETERALRDEGRMDRSYRVGHKETPVHYLHAHQIFGDWPKRQRASIVWPKGCGK